MHEPDALDKLGLTLVKRILGDKDSEEVNDGQDAYVHADVDTLIVLLPLARQRKYPVNLREVDVNQGPDRARNELRDTAQDNPGRLARLQTEDPPNVVEHTLVGREV